MDQRPYFLLVCAALIISCGGPIERPAPAKLGLEQQLAGATSDTARFRLHRALARRTKHAERDTALAHADAALVAAKATGDTALVFLAEDLRGEVLMVSGDTAAVTYCDRLARSRKEGADKLAYARAEAWFGSALGRVNRNVEADSVMALSIGLLESLNDSMLLWETTADRMSILGVIGKGDEAIRLGYGQLKAMGPDHISAAKARTYATMATGHYYMGRVDSAVVWMKRALTESERLVDTLRTVQYLGNLASMVTLIGDYGTALDAQNRQTTLAERFGIPQQVASSLISQGITCDYMMSFDDAIKVFDRGIPMADSIGDERLVVIGTIARALVVAKMDSAHCQRHNIPFNRRNRIVLDQLLSMRGRYAAMGEVQREASLDHNIADLYLLLHQVDSAKFFMDRAMATYQAIGDAGGVGRVSMGLGNLAYERKEDAKASAFFDTAMEVMKAIGANEQIAYLHNTLGEIDARNGRHASAVEHLRESRRLSEQLRSDSATIAISDLRAQFDFDRKHFTDSLANANELAAQRYRAEARSAAQRKSLWMVIGGALFLLTGSGIAFYLDRRRKQERYEKDAALLETQALRSQMNPHFIFNALNSINAYVQTNEADKASDYLAQFARLMRMVLENSRHAEVPLKDDLDALRGYFELERARTNEKFDYAIEVDPGIDQENVLVPPLVLQPFVENAIWHGMAGRTDKGRITLKVSRRGDDIVMAVEDDGRGRFAPKVMMAGMPEKKSSLGTAITKARLDLVGKQKGRPAGFSYTDLPQGTRVEVRLPMTEAA